uniref:ATP synthase subunit a n=1 Tax=Neobartsia pedicularoides TaxID=691774 RepID=A0A141BUH1_9LAMI|nr:ATP synthase subunit 6 [Neobartsia pedicularoides]
MKSGTRFFSINMKRSRQDEDRLNSSSSDTTSSQSSTDTTPSQSSMTINDYSLQSSGPQGYSDGIFKDLNAGGVGSEAYALEQVGMVPSPLDQFSIIPLIPMKIGDFYFSFTNSSLFMLLTLSLVLLLVHFVTKKGGGNLVPNAWQSLVELLYDFVLNLVNEQIGGLSGNVKQKFFPCILVTFTFLLFCNLQGMIPYSFTVTSHFLITLGLSFSLFIGITIVGFQKNGLHFLSFSLPAGVPLPLAPFLVLLELIPHCFRALSLGIRLFANMMAGHSSVKILSGSAWTMLCMNDLFYFIGDPGPLFIVLALTGLELGVAISQAHVSTISICIYLNDATNLHQSAYFFIIEQKRENVFSIVYFQILFNEPAQIQSKLVFLLGKGLRESKSKYNKNSVIQENLNLFCISLAAWPSGKAGDCKSFFPSSNPGVA